jgi:hypothetical protein
MAVGSYRPSKRWQDLNRHLKRRFETIFANVESDYLFFKTDKKKYIIPTFGVGGLLAV